MHAGIKKGVFLVFLPVDFFNLITNDIHILGKRVVIINKWSNFIASVLCYVVMPLTPFIFEYDEPRIW